ncbi:MAG: glycosyltransferase family 2 protein [Candidatus Binatia bacterium]
MAGGAPAITCLLVCHDRPALAREAIRSVAAQEFADWEAVVFDSGVLHDAGWYAQLPEMADPRIRLVRSWETEEIRRTKAIAPWCLNQCFRAGLVRGDLVVYLTDDDVFYPNAFGTFVDFRRRHPGVRAMYASEDLAVVHADGRTEVTGERRARHVGGQCCQGHTLAGFVDYLQLCHTRDVLDRFASDEYWPERLDTQHYGDALFLERLGSLVPVVPIDVKIGQNRRTSQSKYAPVVLGDQTEGGARFACSIVLPTGGAAGAAGQTLAQIAAATDAPEFEVVVVDDGATDATAELRAALSGDVQIVRGAPDAGWAAAVNAGARVARGDHLAILASGALPQAGWLSALVDAVRTSPHVAVVGAKVLDRTGRVAHAGVGFSREDGAPYAVYRGVSGNLAAVNRPRELHAVSGPCLLVRRDVFAAAGGFDERLGRSGAAVDLCLRVGALGRGVSYQPGSVVVVAETTADDVVTGSGDRALADEDTIFVHDGYALVRDDAGSGRLVGITTEDVRVRWSRVGFVQRFVRWGEMGVVRPLLSRPEDWPDDPSVLRWAAWVCERAGWPAAARAFAVRLEREEAAA